MDGPGNMGMSVGVVGLLLDAGATTSGVKGALSSHGMLLRFRVCFVTPLPTEQCGWLPMCHFLWVGACWMWVFSESCAFGAICFQHPATPHYFSTYIPFLVENLPKIGGTTLRLCETR
jgi:hypothetical protein